MKRHFSAVSLVVAIVVVLGLVGFVVAGEQVPFRGNFTGVATITPISPTLRSVDVDASGNATQLGSFTLAIPHIVDISTTPQTSYGTYEFVAANGDQLFATFTGEVGPSGTPGVLVAKETATITGGTGRFAGATGGFTITRFVDTTSVPRTTFGSFEGTISSPGAAGR
jgi:hypothetical protein